MLTAFKSHIDTQFPELKDATCLLAISGGRDSVVLARLLKECAITFSFAHVNFNLREQESDCDQAFVAQLAAAMNIPFFVTQFNTKQRARERGISTQMAARDLRYDWFQEVQQQHNIPFLVTAHHLDDQLETFLINLSRGSGIDGLTGIPSHNGAIRRPLLPFSRAQITQYALENNLNWREDSSNSSTDYLRNAVRSKIVPAIYEVLPDLQANLQNSFEYIKGSKDLVGDAVVHFRESEMHTNDQKIYIPVASLLKMSNPAAYLYELLKHESPHMENVVGLLHAQTGKYVFCGATLVLRDRDYIVLAARGDEVVLTELELNEFNKSYVFNGSTITVATVAVTEPLAFVKKNRNAATFFLDEAFITSAMFLRIWEQGDKMAPYGMNGSKLVSDLIIDHKIPLIDKEKVVVLTFKNNILGVLGLRASKHFAVSQQTANIIMITYTA